MAKKRKEILEIKYDELEQFIKTNKEWDQKKIIEGVNIQKIPENPKKKPSMIGIHLIIKHSEIKYYKELYISNKEEFEFIKKVVNDEKVNKYFNKIFEINGDIIEAYTKLQSKDKEG